MNEARLVRDEDFVGDGLREDGFGCFDVLDIDLKADASDEVRDLPVETDEIFVFEETVDASGLDYGTGDESLGEVAIAAKGDEFAKFG